MLFSMFSRQYLGLRIIKIKTILTRFYAYSGLFQPFFSSKSQSLAFRNEWNDKSSNVESIKCIQSFKFMLMCSAISASVSLAHTKAWDLVLWKCPRHSKTLRSSASTFYTSTERLTCLNSWNVPLLRCLYSDSDIWTGCFKILFLRDLFIILSRFLAGSCCVQKSQTFHDPLINLHPTWKRYTCLKLLECVFISTQTF